MPKLNPSVSGLSIFMSLALGVWELYFFFLGGRWEGPLGWFTPDRLGFNIAWLAVVYISFQLLSIPFALRGSNPSYSPKMARSRGAWARFCARAWPVDRVKR